MGFWSRSLITASLLISSQALADSLCVMASQAQLRKGPSLKEAVTWTVGRYMPFIREDREGNWYKVRDLDGEIHYVSSYAVTQKVKCVAVRAKYAKLRAAPEARNPASAAYNYAEKYVAFKLIDTLSDGYVVEDSKRNRFFLNKRDAWRPIKRVYMSF